ncbi:hypothetical protein HAX54_005944, partial [Datura stramonium]|nr:hypothetical protein [Datura stramonium]
FVRPPNWTLADIGSTIPRRHYIGMTSAGYVGWTMCMAFSQDKADLCDGKAALINKS